MSYYCLCSYLSSASYFSCKVYVVFFLCDIHCVAYPCIAICLNIKC